VSPGDELQVIHPLHLGGLLPILVADLTLPFIDGETFQRKQRIGCLSLRAEKSGDVFSSLTILNASESH